jgi:carboxylate-amine ligase
MDHAFTVGVEEEFQIVDPTTWELRSHVSELLASSAPAFGDQVKREMHQSIVEVGTKICSGIGELAEEIIKNRRDLADAAERVGLRVAAAGTHPFSNWMDQVISPGEARYFLPHLLALSTSSPFWMGRDTGLKSFRTTVFRRFPRTGIPEQFGSWSEYEEYVNLLVELHCIDNAKKIWWDLRPHPTFGTLEFRVCDVPTAPRASIAIAALAQAIVVKLYRLRARNLGFRRYPRALIEENKWRASRWGLDGKLIDFGKRKEVPMRELALELLEFIDDVVDELGSRREVDYVRKILSDGTSAERQVRVYRDTGDLRAVVQALVEETRESVEDSARTYRV